MSILLSVVAVGPLDIVVITLYLAGMATIAVYFARRNTTTEQYFVGNRSFSGTTLGLSLMATSVSSVTFLAFPAAAFADDFRDLVINLMLPVGVLLAVVVFVPMFRRGKTTSAYEYLGERYGVIIRLYGTFSFMIMRLCWLGIVLCLVSNLIVVLTGWPLVPVIIATGMFVALYTVIGGIDAVVGLEGQGFRPYYWSSTPSVHNPVDAVEFGTNTAIDGDPVPAAWLVNFDSSAGGQVVPGIGNPAATGFQIQFFWPCGGNLIRAVRTVEGNGGQGAGVSGNGDVNGDNALNISDVTYLLAYLFQGDDPPQNCPGQIVPTPLPLTGQTTCYDAAGAPIDCDNDDCPVKTASTWPAARKVPASWTTATTR